MRVHLQYQFVVWNPLPWHLRQAVHSNKGSSVDISKCPVSSRDDSTTFPVLLCLSIMSSLPCPEWDFFFLCDVTFCHYSSQNCMKTRNLTGSWDSQIWCWHLTHTHTWREEHIKSEERSSCCIEHHNPGQTGDAILSWVQRCSFPFIHVSLNNLLKNCRNLVVCWQIG